jgi:calcineurin-like phosphoesterase family protein
VDAPQVEFSFVTADPHYRHARIIWFASRPFPDVDTMERTLIERWNLVVPPEANVLLLGDFILVERERAAEIVAQLNGNLYLLRGNHDRWRTDEWFLEAGFADVYHESFAIGNIVFSHKPVPSRELGDNFNVHGHVHRHCSADPKHLCVCCEVTEYSPLTMAQIREYVNPHGYHTEFRPPPGVPEFPPLRLPEGE